MDAANLPARMWSRICGILALTLPLIAAAAVSAAAGPVAEGIQTSLFPEEATGRRVEHFAPHEKINVALEIRSLASGHYTLQTEWYNPPGELQEKTSYRFSHPHPGPFSARSWLSLKRASFMEKLFSVSYTSGYHVKFFGTWTVKLFLNGNPIAERQFEVR